MLLVLAAMLGVIAYVRWNVIQTRPNHAELGIGDSGGRDVDVVDSELGLDKALSAKRHSEMEAEFNTLKYGSAKPEEAEEEEQREAEEIAKPSTATSPAAKLQTVPEDGGGKKFEGLTPLSGQLRSHAAHQMKSLLCSIPSIPLPAVAHPDEGCQDHLLHLQLEPLRRVALMMSGVKFCNLISLITRRYKRLFSRCKQETTVAEISVRRARCRHSRALMRLVSPRQDS